MSDNKDPNELNSEISNSEQNSQTEQHTSENSQANSTSEQASVNSDSASNLEADSTSSSESPSSAESTPTSQGAENTANLGSGSGGTGGNGPGDSDDDSDDDEENSTPYESGNVEPVNIVDELKSSYLDYAMSVIMSRALPDARDGFKPVHRRVIYSMFLEGLYPNKSFSKSAKIVGKVMGSFHPHGDSAIYDTLVRMAQDFSLHYPLVEGQGNFGGRGDESPAAMRYTEARMSKIALELVKEIKQETVDFIPNYSNEELEPLVLPTRIPNLLINGSNGIAVGMATNIPPHNLSEVINGCLAYVDNPDISIDELMRYIPAPDFPTGCQILGRKGIREAYHTGKGKLYLRAVYKVNETKRGTTINITEIPYQVSYNRIIDRIQELIKTGEVKGITEILNLTKKDVNIQLKIHRDFDPHVVMNTLFAKTSLQTSISFNMLALYNGKPEQLNLKQLIQIFVDFRREVITRRSVFELKKSRKRTHILEAYSVTLANIDEVIQLIKSSKRTSDAVEALMARGWKYDILATMIQGIGTDISVARPEFIDPRYGINQEDNLYYFTEEQANAIMQMTLSRLTALEQESITDEYRNLITYIIDLIDILSRPERLNSVLKEELLEVKQEHGSKDARLSPISDAALEVSEIDFVNKEDVVITISKSGYIKYQSLSEYRSQKRGGRGRSSTKVKDEDCIEQIAVGLTTETCLMFTNLGRCYSIPVYKLPRATSQSRGRSITNYIPLNDNEKISNILIVTEDEMANPKDKYIVLLTERGLIKKVPLESFTRIRASGIIAMSLNTSGLLNSLYGLKVYERNDPEIINGEDRLAQAAIISDEDNLYIISKQGRIQAYSSQLIRKCGRTSAGVIGIRLLSAEDRVIGLICSRNDADPICTVTNRGFAKRTEIDQIPLRRGRSSYGVRIHKLTEEKGNELVAASQLSDKDQLAIITNSGIMLRINADSIRLCGRYSSGVRIIRLDKKESIASIERILNGKEIEEDHNISSYDETLSEEELANLTPEELEKRKQELEAQKAQEAEEDFDLEKFEEDEDIDDLDDEIDDEELEDELEDEIIDEEDDLDDQE